MSYKTYEVRVHDYGTKIWLLYGQRHREDGPTIEHFDGRKEWWLNDVQCTEEDFNKKMSSTGGMTIREVEKKLGEWWLNGVECTEEEFNKKMAPAQEMTVLEVEEELGRKVKIIG